MTKETKIYCSAPWRGITIREDGAVRTCCQGTISLGNLNHQSIDEIINSVALQDIKTTLAEGQPHLNCKLCYQQESQHNYSSLRAHYQKYYPIGDELQNKLKFLDLRWNNKCNLHCQYCSPMFSSSWEEKLKQDRSTASKNYQDELLNWILEKASEISELMLVGGEPMLMKQNYVLLKKLPDDCQLSIITNLAYDLESLPCFDNLINRPKNKIIWNISADNVGKQLEYVRNGISWAQFQKNLKLLTSIWPDTVSLNMVYSVFNMTNIDQVIKIYHDMGIKKITLLPINGNEPMMVSRMPQPIRRQSIQVLENLLSWHRTVYGVDADLYPITGIKDLIEGLQSSENIAIVSRDTFLEKIKWHDSWSDSKFRDLWPDVIDLINLHLE